MRDDPDDLPAAVARRLYRLRILGIVIDWCIYCAIGVGVIVMSIFVGYLLVHLQFIQ